MEKEHLLDCLYCNKIEQIIPSVVFSTFWMFAPGTQIFKKGYSLFE
jgi:hypothetical protein